MTDQSSIQPVKETTESSETVFEGVFLRVKRDHVRLPDGKHAIREYIEHPGAVAILAVLPNGNLLLEKQFRYALRRDFIEIPAGKIDPGEVPLETARRELKEETGYTANRWQQLGTAHACIGYADEEIEYFLAEELVAGEAHREDGEHIELIELSPEEAFAQVECGNITDSKTIVGLFWLKRILCKQ